MQTMVSRILAALVATVLIGCRSTSAQPQPEKQVASEWRSLFDGKSLSGWRTYRKTEPPKQGWVATNGCLRLVPGSKPGDLVTVEKFKDFEFCWEWRINAKGNNGVKYLVSEERSAPGPEYQMVDDSLEQTDERTTASLYDILPPSSNKPMRPPGEWNKSAILVRGQHVEHWLNDSKVLEYELGSETLKTAIIDSKFRTVAGFGEKLEGHILLTDHHDEAWYRNLKIRTLR